MSIKVTQGLVGAPRPDQSSQGDKSTTDSVSTAALTRVASAAGVVTATGEAAVNFLRSKSSTSIEKVRDIVRAEKLADDVAGRIKDDGRESNEAHDITPSTARGHFAG